MMKGIHWLKLITIFVALVMGGCAAPAVTPGTTNAPSPALAPASVPALSELKATKNVIQTNVQDTTVQYLRESFWSKNDFAAIVESESEFTSRLLDDFTSTVSGSGGEAINPQITYDSQRRSVILNCEVTRAVSKSGNRYYATFEWLIRPLGLDFIDNDFAENEDGLFWEGDIDGTPTVIEARFPYTGSSYEAWGHPTGHCHAHVWWELAP